MESVRLDISLVRQWTHPDTPYRILVYTYYVSFGVTIQKEAPAVIRRPAELREVQAGDGFSTKDD